MLLSMVSISGVHDAGLGCVVGGGGGIVNGICSNIGGRL